MARGQGTFTSGQYDKQGNGVFYSLTSQGREPIRIGDRGVVAVAMVLPWGFNTITNINANDLTLNATQLFGVSYGDKTLRPIRELLRNAKTLRLYNLNSGGAVAEVMLGACRVTANYGGLRGNDITMAVKEDIDNSDYFYVETYVKELINGEETLVIRDKQLIKDYKDLTDNWLVKFNGDDVPVATAGEQLVGGLDKIITAQDHEDFLKTLAGVGFNILLYAGNDDGLKALYTTYTRVQRENHGVMFQTVLHKHPADYEGIVSIYNDISISEVASGYNVSDLAYWIAGANASCPLDKEITNKLYDGEYLIAPLDNTFDFITAQGYMLMTGMGNEYRIESDDNTLVTYTAEKNGTFSINKTIRIADEIVMSISNEFNSNFLGQTANNKAGQSKLKGNIIGILRRFEMLGAISPIDPQAVIVTTPSDLSEILAYQQQNGVMVTNMHLASIDDKNKVVAFFVIEIGGTMRQLYLQGNVN